MEIYSNIYRQNIKTEIDYIFINSILQNKLWDEILVYKIGNLLEDDTDFIDVGACTGLISLGVNLFNKNNVNIHCFECNVDSFIKLKYNTTNHPNINIYNFGLGNQFMLGNMSTNSYNNGIAFIKNEYSEKDNREISYECFKISENDNVIEKKIFFSIVKLDDIRYMFKKRVSVIKIDIEGYEKNFLQGAQQFIQEHKPYIFIEIFDELKNEIFELLHNYNYHLIENVLKCNEISIDYLFGYNF
jgi:FkbM family methyltransferase